MRSRIVSLTGCIGLLAVMASAQTPAIRKDQGVLGSAGFGGLNKIAAGSLISIYGTDLASTLAQTDSATLSTSMADVNSVTFSGIKAHLQFVFGTQINAQVPWGVPSGPSEVIVTRGGVASQPYVAQVADSAPAAYDFNPFKQAVAVNSSDGTLTAPSPDFLGLKAHPAAANESILFYASGLGALDKTPPADGVNSLDALRRTANTLTVKVGGVPARVDFAGLSPQFTGVYQVNITIPPGVAPGSDIQMQLSIAGTDSVDPATIALR